QFSQRLLFVVRWSRALRRAAQRVIPRRVGPPGGGLGGSDFGMRAGRVAGVVVVPGGRVGGGLRAGGGAAARAAGGARAHRVRAPARSAASSGGRASGPA